MSYHSFGATPDEIFAQKMAELRQGKIEEGQGVRPGTPLSKIDWWCWQSQAFKDCHAIAFRAAQADCQAMGKRDQDSCMVPLADHYAMKGCPCNAKPPEAPAAPPGPSAPPPASVVTSNNLMIGALIIVGAYVLLMPATPAGKAKAA